MKITVNLRGETSEIQALAGVRLLDALQDQALPVNAACGGNGTCHKCRVKVTEGFAGITPKDREAFRESELSQGWRLSCQARPRTNLALDLPSAESLRNRARIVKSAELAQAEASAERENPLLVCDLGSTGVVVALARKGVREKPLVEAHLLNRQVRFGADVMTRLHHAQKNGVAPLRMALIETLKSCLESLKKEAPSLYARAAEHGLYCSGNSAMTSFLLDWSIDTLAVAPFQPASRGAGEFSSNELGLTVRTLPILAGFVGGDTVSGILAIEARDTPEPWMLVDIGTNTEIVVNNGRGELWFSSAPAGPAFEGGNISQGMRAEAGAISVARYRDAWSIETIANDLPRGICGSGLIDLLHESVQAGLITPDGYVPEGRLMVTPEIGLLADDVREFQLAKSATRTAGDLLIERAGVKPLKIYLAGTFAQNLRLDSVAGVGLLPESVPAEAIGNASLEGVTLYASMTEAERLTFIQKLEKLRKPVELALQDDFQERFVRNLNFEKRN